MGLSELRASVASLAAGRTMDDRGKRSSLGRGFSVFEEEGTSVAVVVGEVAL